MVIGCLHGELLKDDQRSMVYPGKNFTVIDRVMPYGAIFSEKCFGAFKMYFNRSATCVVLLKVRFNFKVQQQVRTHWLVLKLSLFIDVIPLL